MGARCVVIAIPNAFEAGQATEQCRKLNAGLKIIARAHSDEEVDYLTRLGADHVIMGEREIGLGMIDWLRGEERTTTRRDDAAFAAGDSGRCPGLRWRGVRRSTPEQPRSAAAAGTAAAILAEPSLAPAAAVDPSVAPSEPAPSIPVAANDTGAPAIILAPPASIEAAEPEPAVGVVPPASIDPGGSDIAGAPLASEAVPATAESVTADAPLEPAAPVDDPLAWAATASDSSSTRAVAESELEILPPAPPASDALGNRCDGPRVRQ